MAPTDIRLAMPSQIEAHNLIVVPKRRDLWVKTPEVEGERVREGQRRRVFRPIHGHMRVHAVDIENFLLRSHPPLPQVSNED